MTTVIIVLAFGEIIATMLSIPTIFNPVSKKINKQKHREITITMVLIKGLIASYLVYSLNLVLIVFDVFLLTPILGILIKYYVIGNSSMYPDGINYIGYPEVDDEKLKLYGINNREIIITRAKEKFIQLQTLISEHNTKEIKELCTNELYDQINYNIEEEKLNKIQTIISDINILRAKISQIQKNENQIEIQIILESTCKTQQKNTQPKDLYELYSLKLIRDYKSPKSKIDECQNCQAPLKNHEITCPYCDRATGIKRVYKDWTIKEKRTIYQL